MRTRSAEVGLCLQMQGLARVGRSPTAVLEVLPPG
jgi:hypothetical protein